MGKGVIIDNLGAGEYKIKYVYDEAILTALVAEYEQRIVVLRETNIAFDNELAGTRNRRTAALTVLNLAIVAKEPLEVLRELSATVDGLTRALDIATRNVALIELEITGYEQRLERVKELADGEEKTAWCADYNTALAGEIGTVEIAREDNHEIMIKPGGVEGVAEYTQVTDGKVVPAAIMTGAAVFYNWSLLPGAKKWRPIYRAATLIAFAKDYSNLCTVQLDEELYHIEDTNQQLNCNQQRVYNRVLVTYMDCDGDAFAVGDRILVQFEQGILTAEATRSDGSVTQLFQPIPKVIGFETNPRPCNLLVVCFSGDTTLEYERRYYILKKGEMIETTDLGGWDLIDDGKYAILVTDLDIPEGGTSYTDFTDFKYRYTFAEGMGLPETATGISMKMQQGLKARFMTNQSNEDEIWIAASVSIPGRGFSYDFIFPALSLTQSPYAMKPTSDVCRYTETGIISVNQAIKAEGGIILADNWRTASFTDIFPKAGLIWNSKIIIPEGGDAFTRTYTEERDLPTPIDTPGGTTGNSRFTERKSTVIGGNASPEFPVALAGMGKFDPENDATQNLIQAITFEDGGGNKLATPMTAGVYDTELQEQESEGVSYTRSEVELAYNIDANTLYGKETDFSGYTTKSGQEYIKNDVVLIHTCMGDKITYVRKEKDTEFTEQKASLMVSEVEVDSDGWQDVIKLYGQNVDAGIRADHNGPILIRPTDYQILHSHVDNKFDMVLYKKVVYKSHSMEWLPYKTMRVFNVSEYFYAQLRRTVIVSEVQYWIAINGTKTQLEYTHEIRENRLSVAGWEYVGAPIANIDMYALGPYMNIGYNEDGDDLEQENNHITRIFTSEAANMLMVGFDVFPVKVYHELNITSQVLHPDYVTPDQEFPPYTDLENEGVAARRWMTFNLAGAQSLELTPPQKNGTNVNRVNGVCMFSGGD
jgi:hypothetical protein